MEQIKQFKDIIKQTLEKIEGKQKVQRGTVKEIQILKADVKDFKEGRLDRIEERQSIDPVAMRVSVVKIKKGEVIENTPYYQIPYEWSDKSHMEGTWTIGFCKNNTAGTYELSSGNIKYI